MQSGYRILSFVMIVAAIGGIFRGDDHGFILACFVGSMAARAHAEILDLRAELKKRPTADAVRGGDVGFELSR